MPGRRHGRHGCCGDGPFRDGGFRRTVPRQAVLEVMRGADDFLSADEVYRKVYAELPGIGIATVYRTLQLLTELGVLVRAATEDGKARYRLAEEPASADRVVLRCSACGRTTAVPDGASQALAALRSEITDRYEFGAQIGVHQYWGTCRECRDGSQST